MKMPMAGFLGVRGSRQRYSGEGINYGSILVQHEQEPDGLTIS